MIRNWKHYTISKSSRPYSSPRIYRVENANKVTFMNSIYSIGSGSFYTSTRIDIARYTSLNRRTYSSSLRSWCLENLTIRHFCIIRTISIIKTNSRHSWRSDFIKVFTEEYRLLNIIQMTVMTTLVTNWDQKECSDKFLKLSLCKVWF